MTEHEHPLREAMLPPEAFEDPLGLILAAHDRQRQFCDQLDELVMELEVDPVAALAHELLDFLKGELPAHTEDEERTLFPLLRQRCNPEDGLDQILAQLSAEHELDKDLVDFMVEDLELMAGGHNPPNPIRFLMNAKEFAATQRRHLSWENRTILPLAHKRLSEADLAALGNAMAERRGVRRGGA